MKALSFLFSASRGRSRRSKNEMPRPERPLLAGNKKDSAFKNCPPLFQTHNRYYMSQSELKETGQAYCSYLIKETLISKPNYRISMQEGMHVNVNDLPCTYSTLTN